MRCLVDRGTGLPDGQLTRAEPAGAGSVRRAPWVAQESNAGLTRAAFAPRRVASRAAVEVAPGCRCSVTAPLTGWGRRDGSCESCTGRRARRGGLQARLRSKDAWTAPTRHTIPYTYTCRGPRGRLRGCPADRDRSYRRACDPSRACKAGEGRGGAAGPAGARGKSAKKLGTKADN